MNHKSLFRFFAATLAAIAASACEMVDLATDPPKPVPALTITNLPRNTIKRNFSSVALYDTQGKVAQCADYKAITVTKNNGKATAVIPLIYSDGDKDPFDSSGEFVFVFTLRVDALMFVQTIEDDRVVVEISEGFGEYDFSNFYGFNNTSFVESPEDNPDSVLQIKRGSSFEINGTRVTLDDDADVKSLSLKKSALVYLYAEKDLTTPRFYISTTQPKFNAAKKGFYDDTKRALFKMLYVKWTDSEVKYAEKIDIADDWEQFEHYTIQNSDYNEFDEETDVMYTLDGAPNPPPQEYTPQAPGWFCFDLKGAGGGHGGSNNKRDGAQGGWGGRVGELMYLQHETALTVYTGSGGNNGAWGDGGSVNIFYDVSYNGAGGGGGGAGAFIYNDTGYFLCAGGGGGGGGAKGWSTEKGEWHQGDGGPGGGGGSISNGGMGRHGEPSMSQGIYAKGSPGGTRLGGGAQSATIPAAGVAFGGWDGGHTSYSSNKSKPWQNSYYTDPKTDYHANGQGGGANSGGGGAGGNNRNTTRAGGAAPGGGAGTVSIYKID